MSEKVLNAYGEAITLTKEQESCVNYTGDKTLLVKGLAGAGKSVVLEALAMKQLKEYGSKAGRKVAILTYQNSLVQATRERLEINGEEDDTIYVSTVNRYIKDIYDEMVRMGIAPKLSFPKSQNADYLVKKNISKALEKHKEKYGEHGLHRKSIYFWHEEITWMKEMNVWTDNMDFYTNLRRIGRGGSEVKSMSASDKLVTYQIFKIYCDILANNRQGDWEDQTLFVIRNAAKIPEKFRFEKILVDEAQDLTLAQMLAVKFLARKSIAIAMDANQRIHSKHWNNKLLGLEPVTKKLTESMRTTVQIDSLAESVRCKNDEFLDEDETVQRAIPCRTGDVPVVTHLLGEREEEKHVIELIKKCLRDERSLTIGVIAPKNETVTKIGDWISSAGINYEVISKDSTYSVLNKGVKLVSSFNAKGLEFDIIIMPLFIEGNYPYAYNPKDDEAYAEFIVKMRNIVYVSMTRARHNLFISYHGNKGSRFIGEMDPSLYKAIGNVDSTTYASGRKVINVRGPKLGRNKDIKERPVFNDYLKKDYKTLDKPKEVYKVGIKDFFVNAGFEVIDNRPEGGNLTIVGEKLKLEPYVNEAKKIYGAFGGYKDNLKAANGRPGWWTTSKK